jgi:hypothetical protein
LPFLFTRSDFPDPEKADYRHAFNGKCLVIVGAGQKAGSIRLEAASAGLEPATLRLRAVNRSGGETADGG